MKNRIEKYISQNGLAALKDLAYQHAKNYTHSCLLDSCELNTGVYGGKYEFLAAYGANHIYTSLDQFQTEHPRKKDWCFGALGYDLKNELEDLESTNKAIVDTPDFLFFIPEILLIIHKDGNVELAKGRLNTSFFEAPENTDASGISKNQSPIHHDQYIAEIENIKEHIRAGNFYELNYCVPFTHTYTTFNPITFHRQLLRKSPVPMASLLKCDHLYLCGASMERFLAKQGCTLTSQPIKGTIRKGATATEDQELIAQLSTSEKDRAENVMIVDLVRNDLARVSKSGSVHVTELFGVYSYLQVHQMISTIQSKLKENVIFSDILQALFPMGSMTGAPKIATMKHIDKIESFKRGWYSGAVGYIDPDDNFDLNVVIRSVLCDTSKQIINYNAGGAITIDSDAETEWKEVHLKTKAITELLNL